MSEMTPPIPLQLLLGPTGHGVTAYGADIAARVLAGEPEARIVHAAGVREAESAAAEAPRAHLHVTARLLGASPEEAAEGLERLASATRLSITLHDLPQPSDGRMMARRVDAYRRMVEAADGTVVNSRHELELVGEHLGDDHHAAVIPLGTRGGAAPALPSRVQSPPAGDLVVLIAGFIYPGKGHAEACRAAAAAVRLLRAEGHDVGVPIVRAIGGPSAGHEADVDDLRAAAGRDGVTFEVSGFLDDAAFAAALRAPGIPVAAHAHVSASRSMLDWIEAGRRPLVADSRYAAEMEALRPGLMTRYAPDALPDLLADAWRRPARTWLPDGADLRPSLDDAAAQYVRWWRTMDAG